MPDFQKLILIAFLAAFSSVGASPSVHAHHPVDIEDAGLVAKGRDIYVENCAACHGENLAGPDNPKDFTRLPPRLDAREGHASHHDDQYLYRQVARGSRDKNGDPVPGGMPAFEDVLEPAEIWAALTYIKSRWPEEVFRKQHGRNPGHGSDGGGGHMHGRGH